MDNSMDNLDARIDWVRQELKGMRERFQLEFGPESDDLDELISYQIHIDPLALH